MRVGHWRGREAIRALGVEKLVGEEPSEVVYLSPADNSPRLTRRLSKGLKGPYEWALMASQQPSHPW